MDKIDLNTLHTSKEIALPAGSAIIYKEVRNGRTFLIAELQYQGAYGMGERFKALNQKGLRVVNKVEEHFCFQGEHTYCPAPFFWTNTGLGLYVQTYRETVFDFAEGSICVALTEDVPVFIFTGNPKQIIKEYQSLFGPVNLPPKWAFGPWISANRWNKQTDVEEQLVRLDEHGFSASVLVVEAWSDEATFYIFNGAEYAPVPDGKALLYGDFDFSNSLWPDPAGMIKKLHAAGVRLVLWQCPVYKQQNSDERHCIQNDLDRADAENRRLCVHNADGTPYTIPTGRWFGGSMVPDFTNPKTLVSWFAKRQYLLDIGVDGFKTDGGEFIYASDVAFYDGSNGLDNMNRYPQSYTSAYGKFVGEGRVLFSRAGYAGQHTTPILWAGDQQSQNSELKSALVAGLSAATSGISFWSFDIGGFAGPLPSAELYRRATQLACFCPVMQWHSEPPDGQFKELLPGAEGNNERSPWNIAEHSGDDTYLDKIRFWHNLRMNLLPYIYASALDSALTGKPIMRPLVYEWTDDENVMSLENEFLFGDALLIAPDLEENGKERSVYLPAGRWIDFFSHEAFNGEQWISGVRGGHIAIYQRYGRGVVLNLDKSLELGCNVGNSISKYEQLHFLLAGSCGSTAFRDDLGNDFWLEWVDGTVSAHGKCVSAYSWAFI